MKYYNTSDANIIYTGNRLCFLLFALTCKILFVDIFITVLFSIAEVDGEWMVDINVVVRLIHSGSLVLQQVAVNTISKIEHFGNIDIPGLQFGESA